MSSLSRYEILSPIGDNHYARFYRGYDTLGERDVCIIEFLEKFRKNTERWDQIWQQILSAGRIKHDYLVSVYDYDRERGWVITELMQGSFRELPAESTRDMELVRTALYRTLETLDYLHSNHHPHGDVRPANLLYDVAGQTRLSYSPGVALGGQIPRRERDHAFLAPEMFDPSFGEIGIGVDLYGCGMTALSLLLGDDFSKKLIGVSASDDVAWQRFHRDVNTHPSVRSLVPNIPPDMEAVIQKLISKRVDQRFTSIAEARALLVRPEVEVKVQVKNVKTAEPKRSAPPPPQPFMEPVTQRSRPPQAQSPVKSKSKHPPFSREWINQKLANPLVMVAVCGSILLAMIVTMALLSGKKKTPLLVKVALRSEPKGATIFVGDKKLEAVTDAELQVPGGEHQLKLELKGYQPYQQKLSIPGDKPTLELPVIKLAAIVEEKKPEPVKKLPEEKKPEPEPKADPPGWTLPAGLEAVGTDVDAETKLPKRVVVTRLKPALKESDVPLGFILLPKGKLTMGVDGARETGELAAKSVEIPEQFYISESELTSAQLQAYQSLISTAGGPEQKPVADDLRNHPALGVPFSTATELCKWLGAEFDLPSEQEWEWAARGSTGRAYPWGDDPPSRDMVRMKAFPPVDSSETAPPTIAETELEKGSTPEGVRHMLGNAAEWCRDLYTPGENETAETAGADRLHVIRGGSYRSPASGAVRITWRANAPDEGSNDVGVRLICRPTPPARPTP